MDFATLHSLVLKGDLRQVQAFLDENQGDIDAYDSTGYTPLMRAVKSPGASVEVVRTLLKHGADIHLPPRSTYGADHSVLAFALSGGNPEKMQLLLEHGADIRYQREHGYNALLDSVHGRDVFRDASLLDLLRLLIGCGVDLNAISSHRESGCRVLSRLGRFDAVGLLLDAGADAEQLRWTSLLRAVAVGSVADVQEALGQGAGLEDKDWWERTPWLLAIQAGDIDKARLLQEHGADTQARGRCEKPPLFYAIECRRPEMLRWLLQQGMAIEGPDEFGDTPLMHAAEEDNAQAVGALLKAGAQVNAKREDGQTALSNARTGEVASQLLNAGADPGKLPFVARRALVGLPPDPDVHLLDVSPAEFQAGRTRRFGTANPEKMLVPFWETMIRAGISGFEVVQLFEPGSQWEKGPTWCAQRFGQSITFLPDGRILQVAGEHEDSYDPDFCIYNDVFIHHPSGQIDIYEYPEAVFPPTDFHTATLLGRYIYLIGSLGYPDQRTYGRTPVYRLDTVTLSIETIRTSGEGPGWIYEHMAAAVSEHEIRVTNGTILAMEGKQESHIENVTAFTLDVRHNVWSATGAG